jgi:hypothetical protein
VLQLAGGGARGLCGPPWASPWLNDDDDEDNDEINYDDVDVDDVGLSGGGGGVISAEQPLAVEP